MSHLPVVFHPDYVVALENGHRFPMAKFRHYLDNLISEGLTGDAHIHSPDPAPRAWLELAHDAAYVTDVLQCRVADDVARAIGLPMTAAVARRAELAVGGTVLTADIALQRGIAFNAAGGSHHARRGRGAGFCVFNDVAVAARRSISSGQARRILIVDLDVHQGDGTAAILRDDAEIFTFSMHCEANYPLRKERRDLDVGLEAGTGDEEYLRALAETLPELFTRHRPDMLFYIAGVDVHGEDPLGRLALTDRGLAERDRMVLDLCRKRACPVAVVMGGGYHRDAKVLARRHGTTARIAAGIFA